MASSFKTRGEARKLAFDLDHQMVLDPPSLPSLSVYRETCKNCGRAFLDAGSGVYGSAIEQACDNG